MDLETVKIILALAGVFVGSLITTAVGVWPMVRRLSSTKTDVTALRTDLDDQKSIIGDLRTEINAVRGERDTYRDEAERRFRETQALRTALDEQALRLAAVEKELASVRETAREVERTNAYLRGRVDQQTEMYDRQIAALRSEYEVKLTELQTTVATLSKTLDTERDEKRTLNDQVQNLQSDLDARGAEVVQLQAQLAVRDEELEARDARIAALEKETGQLKRDLEMLMLQLQAEKAEAERRAVGNAMGVVSQIAALQLEQEKSNGEKTSDVPVGVTYEQPEETP